MKWFTAIVEALKDSSTFKTWGGMAVAVLIFLLGMAWGIGEFGPRVREVLEPGEVVDPSRLGQLLEAERHSGQVPVKIVGNGNDTTAFYESGCQFVLMRWQGIVKPLWIQHPSEMPPAPEHDHDYGDLSAAGLASQRCAPYETCWWPVYDHPGFHEAETIGRRQLDQCWVEELRRIEDGCEYAIKIYLCGGGVWEDTENAQWACCRRHR